MLETDIFSNVLHLKLLTTNPGMKLIRYTQILRAELHQIMH